MTIHAMSYAEARLDYMKRQETEDELRGGTDA
jgi:hypothetical protein